MLLSKTWLVAGLLVFVECICVDNRMFWEMNSRNGSSSSLIAKISDPRRISRGTTRFATNQFQAFSMSWYVIVHDSVNNHRVER